MTQVKTRKQRVMFTVEQKLDYVKLMINEGYTNRQIIDISGAGPTAVSRWKKQYLAELNGQTPTSGKAIGGRRRDQSISQQEVGEGGGTRVGASGHASSRRDHCSAIG